MVSKYPTELQQTEQRDVAANLLEQVESDSGLLNRVITVIEIIHQDQRKLSCRN